MRNFRKLKIWQDAISLVKKIYIMTDQLPLEEKYGLRSQICRAAISIPSNIAEGCSRSSQLEYKRYLEMAIGSAFELETQFIIIKELELIQKDEINMLLQRIEIEQKSINSLINKIKESNI